MKVVILSGNGLNLQVVAVGCYDVAAEVAVAAVVGDWKGFREGFPAKEWLILLESGPLS